MDTNEHGCRGARSLTLSTMKPIVCTARLEFVPVTLEIISADLHRRDQLPRLLDAEIGEGWPPPLCDAAAMQRVETALVADPALGGWTAWYWILRNPRVLIGLSGFKGRPRDGVVEIGYTSLERYHRRGFATEAIHAMVDWAFAQGVNCVAAETLPELVASQRVLLRTGFSFAGEGAEPGVMRFTRTRPGG
jgi:[ribosomal protein S5]-alanine N-acetyltransferase